MKRLAVLIFICAALLTALVFPAGAANAATRVESYITVHAGGDCQVTMTVQLTLDAPVDRLYFPLPADAENVSVNGSSARAASGQSASLVDVSRLVSGQVGLFTLTFVYTIPDAVKVTENRTLELQLPLISGFDFPVEFMSFVVTMPSDVTSRPRFDSTYRQSSIDSDLDFAVNSNMITGSTKVQLKDREAVSMTLPVPTEMFPGVNIYIREGNPELIPLLITAGVALLYWLLFLRTAPLLHSRSVSAPQGISAGEMGCHLTLAGGDMTMMVMSWAQLGYVIVQLDEHGRVLLHKRMDMGNERSAFERKVYQLLFGQRRVIDATGPAYAKCCAKVLRMIPGEKSMYRASSGNMRLFRWICCASHVFCGINVAMNMTSITVLQVLLAIALSVFAAVSAWLIQEIAYRTHLRGKVPVYIGLVCVVIWIVLGLLAGMVWIPLGSALGQWALGYFAAYGGRRSDIGRNDASLILGLRRYLKKVTPQELERLQRYDPEYFFRMAPYALALGVIKPFAKNFGDRRLDQCPYIVTRVHGRRTAAEWAALLAEVADAMDERHRRMMVERWTAIRFR